MSYSPTCNYPSSNNKTVQEIPVEIVSEEEMGLIDAAFSLAAATRRPLLSPSSLSLLCSYSPSRGLSICSSDVEDLGRLKSPQRKKNKSDHVSFLSRFRKKGLYVTDITSTEWCEKQMEFVLNFGKPEMTSAMKAGINRHAKLEEETLGEVVGYFGEVCSVLPSAHEQLLLRYELQEDNSLIGEDEFTYDDDWLKAQIHSCLEFWQGQREAKYVPDEERWKCRFCKFGTVCPSQTQAASESSPLHNSQ